MKTAKTNLKILMKIQTSVVFLKISGNIRQNHNFAFLPVNYELPKEIQCWGKNAIITKS